VILAPLRRQLSPLGVAGGVPVTYAGMLRTLGAVGVWLLQDASGNAQDDSGNSRPLTAGAGLSYRLAGPGGAMPYAIGGFGTTQTLITSDAAVKGTGAFTVGCWVYVTSTAAQFCFCRDGITFDRVWWCGPNQLGGPHSARLLPTLDATGVTATPLNTWHFVAVRYTPSTQWSIWRNGVKDAQVTSSVPASIVSSAAGFSVANSLNGQFPLVGRAAGAFYIASSIADADILALYTQGLIG
jgi:hypothetical protein